MLPSRRSLTHRFRTNSVLPSITLALMTQTAPCLPAIPQQESTVDARHLRGTVELRGETPAERLVKTGSFEISWAANGVGGDDQATIVNGRWEAECHAPNGCELWIQKIKVNGEPALLLLRKFPVVSESRSFAWTFDRMPQASLEVVDARTGGAIGEVEVWAHDADGLVGSDSQCPDATSTRVIGAALPNPVQLVFDARSADPDTVGRCYFVRAKGYAWTSFVVDHRVTGPRFVCLEPAGAVQVKPRAAGKPLDASDQLWVSVWRESGGARLRLTSMELHGGADPAPIESLPAGEILVGTSTKGDMLRSSDAERVTRVNVVVGETTVVELERGKELAAEPIPVTVLCEIDCPAELVPKEEIPQLLLFSSTAVRGYSPLSDTLDVRKAAAGRAKLAPRFENVPPGDYILSGNFPPVSIRVHVGDSIAHVAQRIEDCGTVRLHSSGADGPAPEQLEWSMYGPDGDASLPMPAVFDKDKREWVVRAPVGKVVLQATVAKPESIGQQDLVVAAGETRAELKLVWDHRTTIRLLDAGVPVLLPAAWWESAVVTTAAGAKVIRTGAPHTEVFELAGNGDLSGARPGDVIQLPVPPGYEPLAPIRVPESGFARGVDVRIELVRKKW